MSKESDEGADAAVAAALMKNLGMTEEQAVAEVARLDASTTETAKPSNQELAAIRERADAALAQSVALAGARRLGREWLDAEGVPRALVPILSALTAPEPQRYPGLRLDEYAAQAQTWLDAHLPHAMTDEPCVPCQMATNLILVCGAWFEAEGWQADEWAALAARVEALLAERDAAQSNLAGVRQALSSFIEVEGEPTVIVAAKVAGRVAVLEAALRDGAWFLRMFDSVTQDENDGEFRLHSDVDLHNAASAFRAAIAAQPSPGAVLAGGDAAAEESAS